MQIAYSKDQYNYMYRMCRYFMDECRDEKIQNMIDQFLMRIESTCGWFFGDGQLKIVLNLGDVDIEVLLYIYENVIFFTAEGQRIMRVCEDRFSVVKEKSYQGESNEKLS